jgi:hypothetical protein
MKQERRYLAQEFRVSQDATPVISGYAAVFDLASNDIGWTEEIDPHAFDAVMATNPDVRGLFNHRPDHVLGRTKSGTLKLNIDARGLAYTITPPDTTLAKDLIVSMRRGDINESSFGFICARDQWTDNPDGTITRRILEIDQLVDVSIVTYPAYDQASATVRSLPDTMPVEMRSRFERVSDDSESKAVRALTDQCTCTCPQCMAGSCGICSADPICAGAERSSVRSWQADAMLRLRFAEAE